MTMYTQFFIYFQLARSGLRGTALLLFIVSFALSACGKSSDPNDVEASVAPDSLVKDIPMVKIPAGKFIRGSEKEDKEGMQARYGFSNPLYLDERPQSQIHVDEFWMDVYEVSNRSYKSFILNTNRMMPFSWVNNGYALAQEKLEAMDVERLRQIALDYFKLDMDTRVMDKVALVKAMIERQKQLDALPVSGVNWFDARKYCQWRSARLPSESEWEKAARGPDGLEYPWGNNWDPAITNTGDNGEGEEGITAVGSFEKNKSVYGIYDLSGNVWEWVEDWYKPYEGSTYQSEAFGEKNRVIRGGGGGVGHYAISYFFRGATRQFSEPEMESDDVGFRCAKDA